MFEIVRYFFLVESRDASYLANHYLTIRTSSLMRLSTVRLHMTAHPCIFMQPSLMLKELTSLSAIKTFVSQSYSYRTNQLT